MEAALVESPQLESEDREEPSTQLYRFSTWLHVGPGAEECEAVDEETGESSCSDLRHFHAWCRLPNSIQIDRIRETALAAKARRARALRDPNTNGYAILEDALDTIARSGDAARDPLITELLDIDYWRDYREAIDDLKELEDESVPVEEGDDPPKVYAHIDADQDRYEQLRAMESDERPEDEYEELGRHIEAFTQALDKRIEEVQKPRREALEALDINALIDRVRELRIDREAMNAFMREYSHQEWCLGTLTRPGGDRKFPTTDAMADAAPEIIEALKVTFDDLERSLQVAPGKGS